MHRSVQVPLHMHARPSHLEKQRVTWLNTDLQITLSKLYIIYSLRLTQATTKGIRSRLNKEVRLLLSSS